MHSSASFSTKESNKNSASGTYLKYNGNQLYLIDSPACVSCIPPRKEDIKHKSTGNLKAANGTPITSYGTRVIELNFNTGRKIKQPLREIESVKTENLKFGLDKFLEIIPD